MEKESGEQISSRARNLEGGESGSNFGGAGKLVDGWNFLQALNELKKFCWDALRLPSASLASASKRLALILCFTSSVSSGDGGDGSSAIVG